MKKSFKNILSAAALLMLTATAAFAQDVVANKTVTSNTDGSYTLTLEAYATGSAITTVTEESVPLDIVLVLDVSGSMKDNITSYTYSRYTGTKNQGTTYYYFYQNRYVQVRYTTPAGTGWEILGAKNAWRYNSGSGLTPWTSLPNNAVIYTRTANGTTQKLAALKSASKLFISNVAKQSSSECTHRISIVKFAGDSKTDVGNDMYQNGTYNYSQVVMPLTAASDSTALKDAIDALNHGGATHADFGMAHAEGILTAKGIRSDSNKLVVMFTDGAPTSSSNFEANVANGAVSSSNTLKAAGVKVYTVGIFENPGENVHQYMSAVSSDFPNATLYTDGDKSMPSGDGYYMTADDADELENIFATISHENTAGGTKTTLTATNSSVRDFVTPQFKLANNSASDITVEVVPSITANTTETAQWGEPYTTSEISASFGQKDSDGNTPVIVTGFPFSDLWVGPHRTNGTIDYWNEGAKLRIKIKIVPDPDAANDGGVINTNTDKSGIYLWDEKEEEFKSTGIEFPVPQYVEKGFAYLHIVKSGLADGTTGSNKSLESAIFDIMVGGEVIKTVMVNGETPEVYVMVDWLTEEAKGRTIDSANPLTLEDMIKFTVVERSDWSWNAADPASITSELYEIKNGSAVPYDFEFAAGSPRTTVAHDEASAIIKK